MACTKMLKGRFFSKFHELNQVIIDAPSCRNPDGPAIRQKPVAANAYKDARQERGWNRPSQVNETWLNLDLVELNLVELNLLFDEIEG
jgi:hypothetical protein